MTNSSLDVERIRSLFPSLGPVVGISPAYLDNPGGTQVPRSVINAVVRYYETSNANVGGHFATSQRTVETIDRARAAMASMLNAASKESIIFANNMTSATFHLARSIGDSLRPGDEIIVTDLDHDANIAPWLDLEAQGIVIRVAGINIDDCTLDVQEVARLLSNRTRLVAVTHASNAVGTIPDVAEIVRVAHSAGAQVFVDAVQYAPHRIIDVQALDCDFLVCSAYKFFGPHVGILYAKPGALEGLRAHRVRPSPADAPRSWETGTQNHEGIAGVEAAVEYLASVTCGASATDSSLRDRLVYSMNSIAIYEKMLCNQLIQGLISLPDVQLYGITDPDRSAERLCTVACTMKSHRPAAIAAYLGQSGIYCWSGNYYALKLMQRLGLEEQGGAVRIGPVHYNTQEEIDRLIHLLRAM